MPFEIPENIHELCAPLAWMIGSWHGNGHGDYPTIEGFHFGQELVFQHAEANGRPGIYRVSLDGSAPRKMTIPQDGSDPDWSGTVD